MSRWFRFYDDAMNDPKLLLLSDSLKWAWVTMLCVASQNGGRIPSIEVAAIALRLKPHQAAAVITQLATRGLLDAVEGGYFEPHNWGKRQFKSDRDATTAERQRRYRERNALPNANSNALHNAPPNDPVTRTETESESETDKQTDSRARRVSVSEAFKRFEEKYPKRDGANPREPARKKFEAACKGGDDPEAIVGGAERYAAECRRKNIVSTDKVAQAVTFLNQQRWKDYPAPSAAPARPVEVEPGHGRFYPAIVKLLGPEAALSWFAGLRLVWIQGGVMRLAAPTKFVADRIHSFYDAELLLAVRSVDPSIELVEVVTEAAAA